MTTLPITHSPSLAVALDLFLHDVADWVHTCMAEYAPLPPSNVHDQATYTTAWLPYIQVTDDRDAVDFMFKLRNQIHQHFHQSGAWRHGYWKNHEVHHGTEHFELFLAGLYTVAPDDGNTIGQFIDAAEHIGNWVTDAPPWFDWDSGLFRSMWLGTETVKSEPALAANVPDHFRCANLCLCAYEMTKEQQYLELPTQSIGLWADAIVDADKLPVALTKTGPIYALADAADSAYRAFAGQAPELEAAVDRAENFLASNGISTLLTLWQHTAQPRFLQAAEKLMDVLAGQLHDPTAGAAADIIRSYRRLTASRRYDQAILAAAAAPNAAPITLAIDPAPRRARRPSGIGKRQDMPNWFEDGHAHQHNPILLATAAEISGDEALATQSVDLARAHFLLARRVYPHGRHHGCSARTVSAIARGHGRENNAGMVTGVLAPLWQAAESGLF